MYLRLIGHRMVMDGFDDDIGSLFSKETWKTRNRVKTLFIRSALSPTLRSTTKIRMPRDVVFLLVYR